MGRCYPNKRDAVEDCMVLDVGDLKRRGCLAPGTSGAIHWSRRASPAESIGYVSVQDGFVVYYTATIRASGQRTDHKYLLPIQRSPGGLGGEQLWFRCPECDKPVRKLYLPPSGDRFACRDCLGLSYRSRQRTRDPWRDGWAKIRGVEARLLIDRIAALERRIDRDRAREERSRRGPGRPSKRELRERLRVERASSRKAAASEPRPRGRPKQKRSYVRREPLPLTPPPPGPWAFCTRCRDRRPLKRPRQVTLANGRSAIRGRCSVCDTQAARIVASVP